MLFHCNLCARQSQAVVKAKSIVTLGLLYLEKLSCKLQYYSWSIRYFYLESLVSASLLFMMPKAPTPPEKPLCRELPQTVLGYPFADSESCFCMMASDILFEQAKSRMEIISPESLLPSRSLSQGPSESYGCPKWPCLRRGPGRMALRRPKKALALLQRWQHRQLILLSIQLSTCLITMEITLKSE